MNRTWRTGRGLRPAAAVVVVALAAFIADPLAVTAANGAETTFPAEVIACRLTRPASTPRLPSRPSTRRPARLHIPSSSCDARQSDPLPDGARVSVLTGDPTGVRKRASLLVDGSTTKGALDHGDGEIWQSLGPTDASVAKDGSVHIRLADTKGASAVWAEVVLPDGTSFSTPPFPVDALLRPVTNGRIVPASFGVVEKANGTPTGDMVPVDSRPVLTLVNQAVSILSADPLPTKLAGTGVASVVDFVRITPDFAEGGRPPYFAAVDETAGTATLWDGSKGLPVGLKVADSAWIIDAPKPVKPGGTIQPVTFDRAGLLKAVGLSASSNPAIGITRVVTLTDGRKVRLDGPVATTAWFDRTDASAGPSESATATTSAPTKASAPASAATVQGSGDGSTSGGSGSSTVVIVIALLLAASLAGVAVYMMMRNRRAEQEAADLFGATERDEGAIAPSPTMPPPAARTQEPGDLPARSGGVGVAGARAAFSRKAVAGVRRAGCPDRWNRRWARGALRGPAAEGGRGRGGRGAGAGAARVGACRSRRRPAGSTSI